MTSQHANRSVVSVFLLIGLTSLIGACASSSAKSENHEFPASPLTEAPTIQNSREAQDYREIQSLYQQGKLDSVIQKSAEFENKYPRSKQLAQVHNFHGLGYLLTKRNLQAIHHFQKAIASSPQVNFRQFLLYNLSAARFDANQLDEAQESLSEIQESALDRDTRIKFHSLRSRVHMKLNLPLESAREVLTLSRMLTEAQTKTPFIVQLEEALQSIDNAASLESLYREYEDSPFADLILFRLGSQELALGRMDAGEDHLRSLMDHFPQSSRYAEASDLIRAIEHRNVVEQTTVGVLLPLNGKYARFGTKSLHAIELAFRVFEPEATGNKITLVMEDSGETPEQAVKALDRLFFKHHVAAVIGPLLSKGVDQVTQRAQELGVPLISLAQQTGIEGESIFQAGLTPKLQAREIARYAIVEQGLKKFAILHPRDRFGEQYSQDFWEAVEALGGQIVAVESYEPGETDFRRAVDKLSGLYYTEARQRELDELTKERELNNIKKRTRRTEQYFALKPIVNYDAVFIPDEPKIAGQILPTFAYRDVDNVRFLGTSTWNSPEFTQRAQAYAERAFFTDAFFSESSSPTVQNFVNRFRKTFNESPSVIEALSFDAASILERTLNSSGVKNRSDVRDKLRSIRQFPGVTGKISCDNGQFLRELNILSVRHNKIVQVR